MSTPLPENQNAPTEFLMIRVEYQFDEATQETTAEVSFEGMSQNIPEGQEPLDATNEIMVLDMLDLAAQSLDHKVVPVED